MFWILITYCGCLKENGPHTKVYGSVGVGGALLEEECHGGGGF